MKSLTSRISQIIETAFSKTRWEGLCYASLVRRFQIRPNRALFESHHGTEFFGNPYYLARHVTDHPEYRHLEVVVVRSRRHSGQLRQTFSDAGGHVIGVRHGSVRYLYHLATAGFLVNDSTFPHYFARRPGQRYLNTWHGTPLKTLGRRAREGMPAIVSNTQRNFLHATHILSPNDHTKMALVDDYMIEGIWDGLLIHAGYPRNDILHEQFPDPPGSVVNLAFMPTWRGTLQSLDSSGRELRDRLADDIAELDRRLPPEVVLWVRLHPLVSSAIDLSAYTRVRPFPDDVEPYAHLARCSLLITDYSSVMFDFAETDRPVVLYCPDLESYVEERAFYLDHETLPFAKASTIDELTAILMRLRDSAEIDPTVLLDLTQEFAPYLGDGNAALVSQTFFLDEPSAEVTRFRINPAHRNLLIFTGSMLRNGITKGFKSLLPLIDGKPWRIWLAVDSINASDNDPEYFRTLQDSVGFIPMRSYLAAGLWEMAVLLARELLPNAWSIGDTVNERVWQREWRRLFGPAQFEAVVHFSGYGRRLAYLTSIAPARRVAIVNNSMGREIHAKGVNRRALRTIYQRAEAVAVVRESLVAELAADVADVSAKARLVPYVHDLTCRTSADAPIESVLAPSNDTGSGQHLTSLLEAPDRLRFLNLGRFSAEKGQIRLIDAFEKAYDEDPRLQLFILGGYGPLYEMVRQRVSQSSASESILVAYGSDNPFPLMAKMNAFVLASTYEGQPLTIHEALALGIPVISTDIPGPAELLRQGYGLLVEDSTEGLVMGFRTAIAGRIPTRPYDFQSHNSDAVAAFNRVVGGVDTQLDSPAAFTQSPIGAQ